MCVKCRYVSDRIGLKEKIRQITTLYLIFQLKYHSSVIGDKGRGFLNARKSQEF